MKRKTKIIAQALHRLRTPVTAIKLSSRERRTHEEQQVDSDDMAGFYAHLQDSAPERPKPPRVSRENVLGRMAAIKQTPGPLAMRWLEKMPTQAEVDAEELAKSQRIIPQGMTEKEYFDNSPRIDGIREKIQKHRIVPGMVKNEEQ